MIIYLIRHGKTYCNENKLYCGISDVPLSEEGKKELEEKRKSVSLPICKRNFTSGAKRANETFNILYPNKKYDVIKEFGEYNFGDFEMKSYDMLKDNSDYIAWIMDESKKVKCPNGECKEEFYRRLSKALRRLFREVIEKGEEEALLICHGGVIGTLLELFCKSSKDFYTMQPSCGRGYKLEVKVDKDIEIKILGEI
ncbi:histidine phosphatase family protein [Clostridium sp.]|uniref:histidine phosphatase family protein n=1 Tax=Clostridium sp. TaxID=1506 RepID=UPI00290A384E|nr:histidine phosphatase family protein [Clostridium sp.]MDU4143398.1 histidine phosphatase family protein [Clostridium sp.]